MIRRSSTAAAAGLLVVLATGCSIVEHVPHRPPTGVDLNQATRDEIADLPGVTEMEAERIVEARPYRSKAELVQRGIVPEDVYERFAGRVYVGQPG
jgi:competence protein ComEA